MAGEYKSFLPKTLILNGYKELADQIESGKLIIVGKGSVLSSFKEREDLTDFFIESIKKIKDKTLNQTSYLERLEKNKIVIMERI